MRVTGFVAISILLAALCVTEPAAAQPGAGEPAVAGAAPVGATPAPVVAAPVGATPAPVVAAPVVAAPAPVVAAPGMPPATLSFGSPAVQEPRPAPVEGKSLSETAALTLSLGGTAVSWALLVSGVRNSEDLGAVGLIGTFLAPSIGHWYRGAWVTRGMGVRAVGVLTFAYGVLKAVQCGSCDETTELLVWGGLALYVGGTIDDIVTAPLRVRQHNRRLQQIQLAPMVSPRTAGLALGGRF